MDARTKIFFDFEMTGLHQQTTPISLGLIAEDGRTFYAEFMDWDKTQSFSWLEENVVAHLQLKGDPEGMVTAWNFGDGSMEVFANKRAVGELLRAWLKQFEQVEMWGDVLPYDWVLFCELFPAEDTAERLPPNVYYIPFDIATLMKIKGVDPDINREEFSGIGGTKHNALHDAKVIKTCYEKLTE